jgi:hypothetical protein
VFGRYGIAQKEKWGFDKAIEEGKMRMSRYGVSPNMLVVPPNLLLYLAVGGEEKYVYNTAGPAGPDKFESGVAGYEQRAFRGLGVFTSNPYETTDDTESMQLLNRNSQVGEYYIYDFTNAGTDKGITLYDEESDSLEYFDKSICEKYAQGSSTPVAFLIVRPFIEHVMTSAVVTVAGRDTGATLFGPADMRAARRIKPTCVVYMFVMLDALFTCLRSTFGFAEISANTSVKTIEGCVFASNTQTSLACTSCSVVVT